MQEELENRTVTLMVSSGKFTGRTLKSAIMHFMSYSKHKVQEQKNVVPHGKQSVKKLIGQNQGVVNAPIGDDEDIRVFNRIARKYGVDYAVKRVDDPESDKPKYYIFFKARDEDAINSALTECAKHWAAHGKEEKASILGELNLFKHKAELDKDRAVHKEISR